MRWDRNYLPFWNHPPEFFCQIHGDNSSHGSWSTGANGWELELLMGDVDLGERCTTRIGSSRALTQV